MRITMYLGKARFVKDGKRWALWVCELNGIERPDHTEIARLTDDQAKLLEATGKIHWNTVPDWNRLDLERKRVDLLAQVSEIERNLNQ